MTTLATKQIPADRYKYILEQQPQWGLETAEVTSMRTDFTSPDELQAEVKSARLRRGLRSVGIATVAVLISQIRAEAENELSRSVHQGISIEGFELLAATDARVEVVDFHDPLAFEWKKSIARNQNLASQFLEQTDADY